MAKPVFCDAQPGMTHEALQTMALTLGDYDYKAVRSIYEQHSLRVTPIVNDCKTWRAKGWIEGIIPTGSYGVHTRFNIAPKYWSEIIRAIKPESIEGLLKPDPLQAFSGKLPPLSKAFLDYIQGRPYEEEVRAIKHETISMDGGQQWRILVAMLNQPENADFMKYLDSHLLKVLYYPEIADYWVNLEKAGNDEVLRKVFWENEELEEKDVSGFRDTMLFNVELLKSGCLAEIKDRTTPDRYHNVVLNAMEKMHGGDYEGALSLFNKLLKACGTDVFDEPLVNFAYAIALGQSGTPKARSTAEKLMKSRKLLSNQSCYAMMLTLHHYISSDAAQYYGINPIMKCKSRMGRILAALLIEHYQVFEQTPSDVKEVCEWVSTCEYGYLKLLFSDDSARMKRVADELRSKAGVEGNLLPKYRKKQRWELVIDQLMKMSAVPCGKTRNRSLERERVAYLVEMRNYSVQPKLQKSKDGGATWTKGRNIALTSFKAGGEACMTTQDHRVASLVTAYSVGWYSSNVSYELSGPEVIAALAGCPNVFSATTERHIDIVSEPLQLIVQPTAGGGWTVGTNVDIGKLKKGYYIEQIGETQVNVVEVDGSQQRVLELFRQIKVFPDESKQMLTDLLKAMSVDFTVMSPLLKSASDLKKVEPNSLISVQITPMEGQMFNISLAVKPFGSCPPYQRPGKGLAIVSTTIDGEQVQTERNIDAEMDNLNTVRRLLTPFDEAIIDDDKWCVTSSECIQLLEILRTATDVSIVEWPQGIKMRVVRPLITADKLNLKISSAGQWFELEGDVNIGEKEKLKMAQMLEFLRTSTGNFIQLSDDEFVALSEQLRKQLQAIDKMLIGRGKELKVATVNGMQLKALEEMGANVDGDEPFRQMISRIREAGQRQFPLPANIHAELRQYQVVGYEWMSRLAYWGAGACLADDMGLGKTLQAITLMQSRAAQGPQLVLMPTSLLHNWQAELARFAPALSVKLLNQQGADRQQIVGTADAGDVVLSTYGLLVTEGELLAERTWTTIVLDEAHTIKNRDTQTSKAAMKLKAGFRLMLTGTPLQNHLNEIWNLFQFANPGLLGSYQQFTERFIMPIERDHDQERQRLLRRLLSPFMLRRTKDDVLNELPEKTEITVMVELSADEKALYDNLRQQAIANMEENPQSIFQTLAEITRLRQAACHPRLVNPKLPVKSSKTEAFLNLVEELQQGGHRALVFSQFTSHLALMREELDKRQIEYLYLDGSTSAGERNKLVRQFQTGAQPLFLISLKAGGLGLNLTAADYVVHLDPWWNPAVEDQASDRAHRIGQERPVTVYRLIAAGTIEEKIVRLHQNKRSMADALLEDADLFSQLSPEDVIKLLREGVDAI